MLKRYISKFKEADIIGSIDNLKDIDFSNTTCMYVEIDYRNSWNSPDDVIVPILKKLEKLLIQRKFIFIAEDFQVKLQKYTYVAEKPRFREVFTTAIRYQISLQDKTSKDAKAIALYFKRHISKNNILEIAIRHADPTIWKKSNVNHSLF